MISKKIFGAVTAGLTAVAMMGSVAPVFAESNTNTYKPVEGTSVSFEKYLVFDSNANTPSVTFNFSIAPGTAIAADEDKSPILAGNDVAVSAPNAITIGSAVFAATDDKWTSAQATEDGIGQKSGLTNDPVDLTGDKAYSRHKVLVDFSGTTFAEPGVYRYIITETAMTAAQTELGFVADADSTRYLDVYVADNGYDSSTRKGSLAITGYVLHNTDGYQPSSTESATEPGASNNTKAIGYVNSYETHDLTISKAVTGNQSSSDKYFKYVLTLAEAGANTKLDVDITGADATVASNSATLDTYEGQTNAAVINTDASGAATYTFYLQHNQQIIVKGLPLNASYSIEETAEDYAPTAVISGDTINGKTGETAVAAAVTKTGANSVAVVADTDIIADTTVAFTNTRKGTIPTGIINSVLPGAVVLLGAAGGIAAMAKRRKEDEE